jgi:hypothetical protein
MDCRSKLCITIHNTFPDALYDGPHIPFHSIYTDPFHRPLTIGSKPCGSKTGLHLGMKTSEAIVGTFVGTKGDFLVCSPDKIIIMTPLPSTKQTLENTLYPTASTHQITLAEEGRTYPITYGSSIATYNLEHASNGPLSISSFYGSVTGVNLIAHCTEGLMDSLLHHQMIWKSIFNLTEQNFNPDNFKSESIPIPNVPRLRVFMRSASEPDIERPPSPQASGRKRQQPQSESISAAQVLASSLSTKAQQPVDLLSFAKVMVSLGESAPKKQRGASSSSSNTGSQGND